MKQRSRELLGPNWHFECHPDLTLEQLIDLNDVIVIAEAERKDSDGVPFYIFTVGGTIHGQPVVAVDHINKCVHGCTVEGDVIVVHAKSRAEAEWIATNGVEDTITMLRHEKAQRGTLDPGANAGTIVSAEAKPLH